jgi:nitroreductase
MVRDCGDAVTQFGELNNSMFHAPAVIYLCMDKLLSQWSLFDLGAFSQSLMLAALEYGLGTIPAGTLTNYPDVLHRLLDIPENQIVVIGIAVGYADNDCAINRFHSARSPLDEFARFFS